MVAAGEGPERVAVTVATPPASEIAAGFAASVTVGGASSSAMVSVAAAACPVPPGKLWELLMLPETVTCFAAPWTSLSLAVTVTTPALVVCPAATVRVPVAESAKSPGAAPVPAAAVTVTVVAAADGWERVAVTVATPPASEIEAGVSARVAVGAASSSATLRVTAVGFAIPGGPAAVAVTCACFAGPSSVSSIAVTVTTPTLAVPWAAKVRVAGLESVKSPGTAFVPATACTVSVVASDAGRDRAAVTVATPPASEIAAGVSARVATGTASLSPMVSAAPVIASSAPTWLVTDPVTVTTRPALPWWMSSSTAVTVATSSLSAVSPAAMTMVASPTA